MPRGGRRQGAGAPGGNLNAVTHGRRSRQLRQLFIAATRAGTRHTIGRGLDAALLLRAGLVRSRKRRRLRRAGNGSQRPDQARPPDERQEP